MNPRLAIAVLAAGACTVLRGDLDRIVAIEIIGSLTRQIVVGETVTLEARALTARGDQVPEAAIVWEQLDAPEQAGFTLESTTGVVTGIAAGTGRVVARVETLQSGAITITVSAPVAPARTTVLGRRPSRPDAPRFGDRS